MTRLRTLDANALIALFTGLIVLVTIWQVCVYAQMRDHQLVIERAYVFPMRFQLAKDFGKEDGPDIVVIWKNSGKTPAALLESFAGVSAILEPPPNWGPSQAMSLTLRPNGKWTRVAGFEGKINVAQRQAVLTGKMNLFVWGKIIYKDAFKRTHYTAFGMVWDHESHAFRYVDTPGYNDAD